MISKFFGIILFGGGKSSFFEVIAQAGLLILFKTSSSNGDTVYFVSYHGALAVV